MDDGQDNPKRSPWAVWLVVISLCVVMAALKVYFDWETSRSLERWQAQSAAKEAVVRDTIRRLQGVLADWVQKHDGAEPDRDETYKLLDMVGPLRFDDAGDVLYVDPQSGVAVRLWFRDRTYWTGVLMPDASLFEVPRPKPSGVARTYEALRQFLGFLGIGLWVFLVLLYLLRGSAGAARADLAVLAVTTMAVACGVTFLLLLSPGYWKHWYPTFPIQSGPAFGIALILVSVGLWLQTKLEPRKVDRTPRCRGCGYNLTGNRSGVCPECGRPTGRK